MISQLFLVFCAQLVLGQESLVATPSITAIDSISSPIATPTTTPVDTPNPNDSIQTSTSTTSSEFVLSPTISSTVDGFSSVTHTLSASTLSITETASATVSGDGGDDEEITATGEIPAINTDASSLEGGEAIPRELSADESVELTALNLEVYADHLVNSPLPNEEGVKEEPVVLPACPVNVAALSLQKRGAPKKPTFYPCMPTELEVEVYYWYVPETKLTPTQKAELSSRVLKQHAYFEKVTSLYGITLLGDSTLQFKQATKAAARFSNQTFYYTSSAKNAKEEADIESYRKKTRVGGPETLNVWIVNNIHSSQKGFTISGYAQLPEYALFNHDGIVLNVAALRDDNDARANRNVALRGVTLIHEFGHWMGLKHTFGDSNCRVDDGIADTPWTSNVEGPNRDDYQKTCQNPVLLEWMNNYMCYSSFRGTKEGDMYSTNYRSFTKGQRSQMFAHFFYFRNGLTYSKDFCKTKHRRDMSRLETREELHALQRRAEDKAKALADLLLSNCSIAIQDVYQPDSIPLPSSALASYSSAASSMAANPTQNSDPYAPKTVSLGTGLAVTLPTGTTTGALSAANTDKSPAVKVQARWPTAVGASLLSVIFIVGLGV